MIREDEISRLYERLDTPVTPFDCGQKCAPNNPNGIPFCCDPQFAVPAVYNQEWEYLRGVTDQWRLYPAEKLIDPELLLEGEPPEGMLSALCLGPHHCIRRFRSLSCRQFPFFPYITSYGRFIGLAYEWLFEGRCWVCTSLDQVSQEFCRQFVDVYTGLLAGWGPIFKAYYLHSETMREQFIRLRRRIPVLLPNGRQARISPRSERIWRGYQS